MRPLPVHLALAVVLGALLSPSGAVAQTCTVLPPGMPPGQQPPAEAQRAALDAVTRALTSDGFIVIDSADAQRRMEGEPFARCNALTCADDVVRALELDFAVLVTVWAPRAEPTSVVVTLIGTHDSSAGDQPVDGDLVDATLRAFAVALEGWQAAHLGSLEVRSDPPAPPSRSTAVRSGRRPSVGSRWPVRARSASTSRATNPSRKRCGSSPDEPGRWSSR